MLFHGSAFSADSFTLTRSFHMGDESPIESRGYVNADVLVSTQWVADHLDDRNVRIVESDEDIMLYEVGHIPGAIKLDWQSDLQDHVRRDFIDKDAFSA